MGLALFFVLGPGVLAGADGLWLFWFKLHISPGTGFVPIRPASAAGCPHDPALDRACPAVRRLLRPHDPRQPDRDDGQDYIRTARVKGLSETKVIFKHGLRASLTPIVTLFGLDLGACSAGR
jgi:hypothetical protein